MLHDSVLTVIRQSEPCFVLISVPEDNAVLPETRNLPGVRVLVGTRGTCVQRNQALRSIEHRPECILFLDDDVELDHHYVREILACYRRHPSVAVVNGRNLAHGIFSAGTVDRALACRLIEDYRREHPKMQSAEPGAVTPMSTTYGCRMSIRGSLLGKVSFDERLVLYAFLEDLDFALQCRPSGTVVESVHALGVHLEVASGRMDQKRRGYAEVINPLYLWSKRTGFPLRKAVLGSARRTAINAVVAVRERESKQLAGNLLAWMDAARGRFHPEKILELS
jgi:GT2 family glycosyltransferase